MNILRKTKLFAKRQKQKTLCHYNYKCKSRADVMFTMKEQGRSPNDLGLCEAHARELLEALMKLYGKKAVTIAEEELLNAVETIQSANKRIDKLERIIDVIFDNTYSKNKSLTFKVVEGLLAEEGLEWTENLPNIKKGLKMYIEYEKPMELIMREQAAIDLDDELAAVDMESLGLTGEDLSLDALMQEVADDEGEEIEDFTIEEADEEEGEE